LDPGIFIYIFLDSKRAIVNTPNITSAAPNPGICDLGVSGAAVVLGVSGELSGSFEGSLTVTEYVRLKGWKLSLSSPGQYKPVNMSVCEPMRADLSAFTVTIIVLDVPGGTLNVPATTPAPAPCPKLSP